MIFTILLCVTFVQIGYSMPVHWQKPWENALFFEGDLVLPPNYRLKKNVIAQEEENRGAVAHDVQLWPNGIIPYHIDSSLESKRPAIEAAMRHIEDKTCIKFKERGKEIGFVVITLDDGCYSYFGRAGIPQPLSLDEGCYAHGTIVHELNHAVGFYDEHTRSDRDNYIDINYNNVDPDFIDQFRKLLPQQNRLINDFDYDSIMMYGPKAFSKDDVSVTIKPKWPHVKLHEVHNKPGLSPSDVFRINTLYKCKT